MKRRFLSNQWRIVKLGFASAVFTFFTWTAQAQEQSQHSNPNVRLGQKALLDGDFKAAATHLQKALPAEANDPDVQYLLGYSQFHNGDYTKAIETFKKVVALDPKHTSAYYYKAKASNNLAVASNSKISNAAKEQLLKTAIEDYSKAIAISANDAKLYQNRAIAYRDLGILTGTAGAANYDKTKAADAYNKAVSDYEKVLTYDASRKDIQTEVKKAKVYRDNLK
ncbi:tetratricopeptide repeat protein [Sphingobacterium allocomposti]|uniref:Tetratricopeptide repeat protein n=1 Tax=Sphingobacterium allocomposti TaxID=415956 RepID=A0A5S5DHV1_9SPHI|nr:tetratricopeptide repeat protein [Sphingobacterium composti Yoo et al. 2007 non Ten et al. 2007]TYP94209.1 tetratricopeptide repeat protein [Sphingobacterium composti Yoo et al. 2007 non Ten et al. 2007]